MHGFKLPNDKELIQVSYLCWRSVLHQICRVLNFGPDVPRSRPREHSPCVRCSSTPFPSSCLGMWHVVTGGFQRTSRSWNHLRIRQRCLSLPKHNQVMLISASISILTFRTLILKWTNTNINISNKFTWISTNIPYIHIYAYAATYFYAKRLVSAPPLTMTLFRCTSSAERAMSRCFLRPVVALGCWNGGCLEVWIMLDHVGRWWLHLVDVWLMMVGMVGWWLIMLRNGWFMVPG